MPARPSSKKPVARAVSPAAPATLGGEAAPARDVVLLAVTGLSPAVVTETLWALAHEKPRVLPRRVEFLTTATGARRIGEMLFSPAAAFGGKTAWQALREALKARADELIATPPSVIGRPAPATGTLVPLDDIATPQDNEAAAARILEAVRAVVENPDTRLVASIAGGRKTMGALLHAAVSLVGRESDRLTHVLVTPPYETLPGFFFPGQPGPDPANREGRAFPARQAEVRLADVPFVPLRNRFEDLRDMPGSFDGLVRRFARQMKEDALRPALVAISYRRKSLGVDGLQVPMRPRALAVLHFLLDANAQGAIPVDQQDVEDRMPAWLAQAPIPPGLRPARIVADDVRHELSEIRTRLRQAGVRWTIPQRSLALPPFRLQLLDPEKRGRA